MRSKKYQAKDNVYAICILLCQLKFKLDILKMQRKSL